MLGKCLIVHLPGGGTWAARSVFRWSNPGVFARRVSGKDASADTAMASFLIHHLVETGFFASQRLSQPCRRLTHVVTWVFTSVGTASSLPVCLPGSPIRTGSLPVFPGIQAPTELAGSQPSFLPSRICFECEGLGSPGGPGSGRKWGSDSGGRGGSGRGRCPWPR